MLQDQKIKEKLKTITEMVLKLNTFYYNLDYLIKPNTTEEILISKNYSFLRKVKHSFFVITVLDICKLFSSKNEDFSIKSFLNELLQLDTPLNVPIEYIPKAINWCELLEETFAKELIKKLKVLRDKYYAHNDSDASKDISYLLPVINEASFFVELGKEIVVELNSIINNCSIPEAKCGSKSTADDVLRIMIKGTK